MTLGASISVFLAAALAPRAWLERRYVLKAPHSQAGRQLFLDFALVCIAGVSGSVFAFLILGFPSHSTYLLGLGFIIAAFFISVDMALARERKAIIESREKGSHLPPRRFFSFTRKFFIAATASILLTTVVILLVVARDINWINSVHDSADAVSWTRRSVAYDIQFIMGVFLVLTMNMIWSYSKNLKLLFNNEISVLESVSNGDLSKRAPVATSDEFGVIAGHTNHMISGLSHRMELLSEMRLAQEVQQNLLPSAAPVIPGLDIFGKSVYCDQTGGDYYDFIGFEDCRLGIVTADASGHGIGAAMHMTTARAIFRTLAAEHEKPEKIMTALNKHLTADTWETGRFMTMFYALADPCSQSISWVRAGHDAAFLYDPETDKFESLMGKGVALGLAPDWQYEVNTWPDFSPGQILVLATDGIWEASNPEGALLGKEAVREIIRAQAKSDAKTIGDSILDAAQEFRQGEKIQDDMTIVVVKVTP